MSTTQKQLLKVLEKVRQIEKVEAHLEGLNLRLDKAYRGLDELGKVLEKEVQDYEKLESLSLKSVFYKVLGSKEEQMEKERQEYLQATLKYEEHRKSVELLEYEQKVLEEKRQHKKGLERKLNQLLKAREREIKRENGPIAKQLILNQKETDHQQLMVMEVREAMKVGAEAANVLDEMIRFLSSARNWGKWNMARRGRGAAYHKHSNIDRARERAYLAQQLLHRFEEEMRDVYSNVETIQLNLNLDSFSRFIDVFFDNLISDWIIQQKIQNALTTVKGVRDRLSRLLGNLEAEEKRSKQEIKVLRKAKRNLLKNSFE